MFLSSVGEAGGRGLGVVEFFDRERFAGEAALADEEILGREDAHVAGDHVAGGETG